MRKKTGKKKKKKKKNARRGDISPRLDLLASLAISTFVRRTPARRRPSEFLGYIIRRSFCGAFARIHTHAKTHIPPRARALALTPMHTYVNASAHSLARSLSRTPPMSYKPAGQSCGRYQLAVLSALYTGRPSGVATRDLTQIGEAAAAAAQRADSQPVGPGIARLRSARLAKLPAGRSFVRSVDRSLVLAGKIR